MVCILIFTFTFPLMTLIPLLLNLYKLIALAYFLTHISRFIKQASNIHIEETRLYYVLEFSHDLDFTLPYLCLAEFLRCLQDFCIFCSLWLFGFWITLAWYACYMIYILWYIVSDLMFEYKWRTINLFMFYLNCK